ncbi:GNAT family N-acetyltransferase [Xanthomonas campestris]|uniref:GNAT family N-acetyltransferase n=1 Tax=Xanthomonas campestris TaxID=339 RepID=UPI002378D9EA|nr:GNAT family N-acetyltransferase [Xanthomonas campestris]WDJ75403.1 GNAT family N-acetyltransferase [Xanthomonas campestris pv. campestris]
MKIEILEQPPDSIIAAIEEQISREPNSSITTIRPEWMGEIYDFSYTAAIINNEAAAIALIRWPNPNVAELYKLVVIKRFRKAGVGKKLAYSAIDRCRREGFNSVMIQPTNNSENFWEITLKEFNFKVYEHNDVIDITL